MAERISVENFDGELSRIEKENAWIIDRVKRDFPDTKIKTGVYDLGMGYAFSISKNGKRYAFILEQVKINNDGDYITIGINYSNDREQEYEKMVSNIKNILGE